MNEKLTKKTTNPDAVEVTVIMYAVTTSLHNDVVIPFCWGWLYGATHEFKVFQIYEFSKI